MQASEDELITRLITRAQNGEQQAWEELFDLVAREEEAGALILAMARRLLPRNDRARDFVESRDVMQSALRSGWLHAQDFRGTSKKEFIGWLLVILRNKVARAVRRKRPQVLGDLPEAGGGGETDPVRAAVRQEIEARVRAAVERLPQDQRAVMTLRLKGMKAPEIAERLGLKPDAVRKRESRAAKRLREILG